MEELYEKLLTEYDSVLLELTHGIPLTESLISNLMEYVTVIDFMTISNPSKKELKTIIRKYL